MKTFDMDSDTKQMLQEISATFGVKNEIIKEVWEYTIFTVLLKIAENPDKRQQINIPFLGHMLLKDNGIKQDENNNTYRDIEPLVALSENFKNLYVKACRGQFDELSEYLEENYIKPVLDEIK
jgi:hypothetical protein